MRRFTTILLLFCAACYGECDDEEGLRTVPITNNPNIVPSHGGAIPGIGSGGPN